MTNIYYCEKWSRGYKEALEPFTKAQASAIYDKRELYTALIGDSKHPDCFVECNLDYIGVEFLDEHLRSYVIYQFTENRPGMLFLTMAVYQWFDDDSDNPSRSVNYYYNEVGTVTVHKYIHTAAGLEKQEVKRTLDTAANWEPYPKFGEYESITRQDRGMAIIH